MGQEKSAEEQIESLQQQLAAAHAFHDLAVKERDALRVGMFSVKSDAEKLAADLEATKKAYFELEKVLLREGGVEGAYERRLAERQREACAVVVERNVAEPQLRACLAACVRQGTPLVTEVKP